MTIGLATLAALIAWFLFTQTAGVDLATPAGPVGAVAVAVVGLIVGFAAWGLLVVLERAAGTRARRIWRIIASVVLAVSLLGPLGGVGGAAVAGLICLHLIVGLVLIAGLPRPVTTTA